MAAVKGSKQYQMVVVPHRPIYKTGILLLFVLAMMAFSFLTYEYGMGEGLTLQVEVVKEKDLIKGQLAEATKSVDRMRQVIASLKLGGEVDSRATEEVRQTVEALQDEIALLNEEIMFYKGVMVPNAEDKGLRIERLSIEDTPDPNKFRYSLLLTQIVDKHDYVQGGVEIALVGSEGVFDLQLSLSDMSQAEKDIIGFRFRYFQNINGELNLPIGFEPRELVIVARSSGRNSQRLEKKFSWQLNGG
jgi:hypothetical protein